jgi:hypothetical protein
MVNVLVGVQVAGIVAVLVGAVVKDGMIAGVFVELAVAEGFTGVSESARSRTEMVGVGWSTTIETMSHAAKAHSKLTHMRLIIRNRIFSKVSPIMYERITDNCLCKRSYPSNYKQYSSENCLAKNYWIIPPLVPKV